MYVAESGVDTGTCPKMAPCKSLPFALGLVNGTRHVVRILGGELNLGGSPVALYGSAIIDGSNTTLLSSSIPVFTVVATGTVEGVRMSSASAFTELVRVSSGGAFRLAHSTIQSGELRANTGSIEISDVSVQDTNVNSTNATLIVTRANFDRSHIDNSGGVLEVSASRFEAAGVGTVSISGGLIKLENNVFVETVEGRASVNVFGYEPGSTFRFNTIINTSSVTSSGFAVVCADGLDVTSNIFSVNSTRPIICVARRSLFDLVGVQEMSRGEGNLSADAATFFEDRATGDFHLSATSPAIGIGETGLVVTDLDGNDRPLPSGSQPDVGAYEAP